MSARGSELTLARREELDTAKHESFHGALFYHLLGERAVGQVMRVATKMHMGSTRLADLDGLRDPGMNAFDLATGIMGPTYAGGYLARDDRHFSGDLEQAWTCAEFAYSRRPGQRSTDDPQAWGEDWLHLVAERAKEMVRSEVVLAYARALEWELLSRPTVPRERAVRVLRGVDEKRALRWR
jgi:hypothetical protein